MPGNFTSSNGWLDRLKRRHGVHQLKVCGEKLSVDISVAVKFIRFINIACSNAHTREVTSFTIDYFLINTSM